MLNFFKNLFISKPTETKKINLADWEQHKETYERLPHLAITPLYWALREIEQLKKDIEFAKDSDHYIKHLELEHKWKLGHMQEEIDRHKHSSIELEEYKKANDYKIEAYDNHITKSVMYVNRIADLETELAVLKSNSNKIKV